MVLVGAIRFSCLFNVYDLNSRCSKTIIGENKDESFCTMFDHKQLSFYNQPSRIDRRDI